MAPRPLAPNRRAFLGGSAAALAAATVVTPAALTASPAAAQSAAGPALTRRIPSSGEEIPAVGLGTFLAFDLTPGQKREHLFEVTKRFWEAGGRVVDTSPLYGTGEITTGDALIAIGANQQAFVANKLWSTGEFLADDSHAVRSLDQSLGRLWRDKIDLMQCHSLVNAEVMIPLMQAWKKEGRIRYVGATHYENPHHAVLASWIARGKLDVVQVNYSIFNRAAEETVLKEAEARGCAVLVNMPFEKARLFKAVEGQPLPAFASEIGAATWAAFFLKWVLGHPAVTCVIPATSDPEHASENMAALRGPLPDAAMRARMARHMETIPAFAEIGKQPWYPGKRYPGLIARAQAAIRARG
ncbi:aldo/keto reductase [Methylopila turkensis]|uniref:Oxidoreductase n=1 Tax=Methylopila turkensis TaxID=1437816 RepID=A0A9W6N698_9HYPH|nr:aldo/keto reductase [Methylopila turkensis]GLK79243.1 oxidoreductase [Methylopila turkensis]